MITRGLMQQRGGLGPRAQDIIKGVGELTMQQPTGIQTAPMAPPIQAMPIRSAGSGGLVDMEVPVRAPSQTITRQVPASTPEQVANVSKDMLPPMKAASAVAEQEKAQPALVQDPVHQERVNKLFGGRDRMLRLAMAFNTLRFQPDQGLAKVLSDEIEYNRDQEKAKQQLGLLQAQSPKLAAMVRAGMPIKDAMALVVGESGVKVVGNDLVRYNRDGSVSVLHKSKGGDDATTTAFRTLKSRAEAAGLREGTEEYRRFMLAGGAKSGLSIQFNEDGTIKSISEGGDSMPNMSEGQGKATMFAARMASSQGVINQFEQEGTDLFNQLIGNVPVVGNLATSPEFKQYAQAKRDFINAILRFESGAAIGQDEFTNAALQYFPVAGDDPATIAQKRRNRDLAIETMRAVSGGGAEALAKQLRVQMFGPEAADWPQVGTVKEGYTYIGGDPSMEQNWKKK